MINKEKKVSGYITGNFFKDFRRIGNYIRGEAGKKKSFGKYSILFIIFFLILFSVMLLDIFNPLDNNYKIIVSGGFLFIGAVLLIIKKYFFKQ